MYLEHNNLKNIAGDRVADFIKDWMLGLKNPTKTDSKMMARISSVANAGILGWSITRSLVQISGIIPAMSIIKPRYMVSAIPKNIKGYGRYGYFIKRERFV